MKHYQITLTEDTNGFWLARLKGIDSSTGSVTFTDNYGRVEVTPIEALVSLIEKVGIKGSGAIIIEESH